MKTMRKVHFWIGVIASLFLFIESLTGMVMYFNGHERGERIESIGESTDFNNQKFLVNPQNGNVVALSDMEQFREGFLNGQGGEIHSLQRIIRELHTGPIGLISSIGTLVLTGTGLAISFQMLMMKRRARKRVAMEG
jgi:uncharacterized iron-regulated membrane protein